jgi:hypothetical protein
MSHCTECARLEAEIAALNIRRREGRGLLQRMVKLAREPAVSAGFTRLERVIAQVDDYLSRTHDPKDILR